jgi:hypothetical protein
MTDFIGIYDNALPAELCGEILSRFEKNQEKVGPGLTGDGVNRKKKDSSDLTLTGRPEWKDLHDQVIAMTIRYVAQYMTQYKAMLAGAVAPTMKDAQTGEPFDLTVENFERLSEPQIAALVRHFYRPGALILQHYRQGTGGYHHWHSEAYPRDQNCETLHRVLLFMFYLNDVAEGGETSFLYQDQHVQPVTGRMVIAPAGFTHTHKGQVPQSSDKAILTSWILFQRAEKIYSVPGKV